MPSNVENLSPRRSVLAEAQIAPLPPDSDESFIEKDHQEVRHLIMLDYGLSHEIFFRYHRAANEVY